MLSTGQFILVLYLFQRIISLRGEVWVNKTISFLLWKCLYQTRRVSGHIYVRWGIYFCLFLRFIYWFLENITKVPFRIFFCHITSVGTEMCCPKGKCGCQYFILLTLKKNSWTQGSWFIFNRKLTLDYYFCLKSGPVFLFQIFIIAPPPPPPKGYKIVSLIIN